MKVFGWWDRGNLVHFNGVYYLFLKNKRVWGCFVYYCEAALMEEEKEITNSIFVKLWPLLSSLRPLCFFCFFFFSDLHSPFRFSSLVTPLSSISLFVYYVWEPSFLLRLSCLRKRNSCGPSLESKNVWTKLFSISKKQKRECAGEFG